MGKKHSEVDRAYCAGFLDADGAIMALIEKHQEKKFGFRVRIVMKITQKERAVLDWFRQTFGIGEVRANRTTFDWMTRDQKQIADFLRVMTRYLKTKQQQALLAQKILHTRLTSRRDLVQMARTADALSRLNVRSKNRRKNYVTMIEESFSPND